LAYSALESLVPPPPHAATTTPSSAKARSRRTRGEEYATRMNDHPIRLVVTDDLRRSRLTVFFRLLLAIPHFLWIALWGVAAVLALIVNWFATLFAGRSPDGLHDFLARFVRYATPVNAYAYPVAAPFP